MAIRQNLPAVQLDLLGGVQIAEVHRLFLALIPDEATRARLGDAAAAIGAGHPALRARWVNPARYHATLHFLGDHTLLRTDVIDAAKAAATAIRVAPFEWLLDDVVSFRGRQPPCVACSESVPGPFQQLWQELRDALVLNGQGRHLETRFTPHVTLAYSHGTMLERTPIAPVAWRVDQVALIRSADGQADYQVIERWPLRPADQACPATACGT